MKDSGEHDDLWQLLGKAKKTEVSPLFSRNVLREIRSSQQKNPGFFFWLRSHVRLASLATAATILLAVNASQLCVTHTMPAPVQVQQLAVNVNKAEDPEVISHLDELVAYEENSIWLEDSSQ